MDMTLVFRRTESKYFLTQDRYRRLMSDIGGMLEPDVYGRSTVCSLYPDTPDFGLARRSAEAVGYKEKLRIRSYGEGAEQSANVFFEIKKKYDGIVYKRRVTMTLAGAEEYLSSGIPPCDSQIMREIDYAMRLYRPSPAAVVSYEREAFTAKDAPELRLTFDTGVRFRTDRLSLSEGSAGEKLLPDGTVLLEVKSTGGMPERLTQTGYSRHRSRNTARHTGSLPDAPETEKAITTERASRMREVSVKYHDRIFCIGFI